MASPITKSFTLPVTPLISLTLTIRKDLGVFKPKENTYMLAGFCKDKIRLDAVSRIKTFGIVFLFLMISVSKMYVRR